MVILVALRGRTIVGGSGGLIGCILCQTQPKASIYSFLPNSRSKTESAQGFLGCISGVGR